MLAVIIKILVEMYVSEPYSVIFKLFVLSFSKLYETAKPLLITYSRSSHPVQFNSKTISAPVGKVLTSICLQFIQSAWQIHETSFQLNRAQVLWDQYINLVRNELPIDRWKYIFRVIFTKQTWRVETRLYMAFEVIS